MSSDRFTEQLTEKTFTNDDGVKLIIKRSKDYPDTIELVVNDAEFFIPCDKVDIVAKAMQSIAD